MNGRVCYNCEHFVNESTLTKNEEPFATVKMRCVRGLWEFPRLRDAADPLVLLAAPIYMASECTYFDSGEE